MDTILVMYLVIVKVVYGNYNYYTIEEKDPNKPFVEHKDLFLSKATRYHTEGNMFLSIYQFSGFFHE